MATNFSQRFARASAERLILSFGEPLTYNPETTNRDISGIVIREYAQIIAEVGDVSENSLIIRVLNDATDGITSVEIDVDDQVSVPIDTDGTPLKKSVVRVLNDNAGMTRFLVS
jgi:hypothetical protein